MKFDFDKVLVAVVTIVGWELFCNVPVLARAGIKELRMRCPRRIKIVQL